MMEKSTSPTTNAKDGAVQNNTEIIMQSSGQEPERMVLPTGKLQLLNAALCIGLFLSALDSTIVSTALVPITNSLRGFDRSSWIINAYLLTYTGFLVITAKMSDIFGRRRVLNASLVIFIIASIACGVAQTLNQLIVFRAFQGIGGGGIYAMVFVILPEMCTPAQYTLYSTIVSSVAVFSSLLGPLLGGLIGEKTTWRWIFWINIPLGVFSVCLLYIALPAHFPHPSPANAPKFSRKSLHKLDVVGTILLLAASTLVLTALEESGIGNSWTSPVVLCPLIIGLLLWCSFIAWSRYQESRDTMQEPILPWRILTDRFCMALFASSFWVGSIVYSAVFALPQRYQVVHRTSALVAGYRLLPLSLGVPVGSALGAVLMQKRHIPPFYLLFLGAVVEMLGAGLLISLPTTSEQFPASGYGFELICGVGMGVATAMTVLSAMLVFKGSDLSVGMGGIAQFRSLGGCMGISVCINVMNRPSVNVSQEQLMAIRVSAKAIELLPAEVQRAIRASYAEGFQRQAIAMTAFGGVAILMTLLMVERRLRRQM